MRRISFHFQFKTIVLLAVAIGTTKKPRGILENLRFLDLSHFCRFGTTMVISIILSLRLDGENLSYECHYSPFLFESPRCAPSGGLLQDQGSRGTSAGRLRTLLRRRTRIQSRRPVCCFRCSHGQSLWQDRLPSSSQRRLSDSLRLLLGSAADHTHGQSQPGSGYVP